MIVEPLRASQVGLAVKNPSAHAGDLTDMGSIPGLRRSPGEEKGYPLQYCGLKNSMDCIVRGVSKSRTRLSGFHFSSLSTLQPFACLIQNALLPGAI